MTEEDVRRIAIAAAEEGATRALARLGLHDADAGDDVRDLRRLLSDWRKVRSAVLTTTARVITTAILAALAAGAALTWFRRE